MRSFRFLPLFLSLAAIPSFPMGAIGQNDERYTEQSYREQYQQRRRDRQLLEEEKLQEYPGCTGCDRRTEGIQSQPIPGTPLIAVLNDLDPDDGILTVRLRIYNDGSETIRLTIDSEAAYESIFVGAGEEKLSILRNDHGDLEAKDRLDVELRPGEMESWWMDFPAPPEGTEKFDIEIPPIAPFQNLSLDDI